MTKLKALLFAAFLAALGTFAWTEHRAVLEAKQAALAAQQSAQHAIRFGATVPFSTVVAGGDLSGHFPDPAVDAITESGSSTSLSIGAVTDGQLIARSGTGIVGLSLSSGTIALDASSAIPSITSGASTVTQVESSTNHQNSFVVDYADGSTTYAEWPVILPGDYNGGTVTATPIWLANSASTNAVVWGVACLVFTDGDAQDTAYGTAVEVTDANQGTNLVNQSAATAAITCGGTTTAGKRAKFRAYRKGGDASDTLADTARLLTVKINYTKAAP